MVAKLTGTVNGKTIIFQRNAGGGWETTVPPAGNAKYIIELWATDEAGNTSYFATIKLAFDTSQMCMVIEILDVGSDYSVADVKSVFSTTPLVIQDKTTDVQSAMYFDTAVMAEIVRCEVCGR